ncbi:hypothetical protein SELR_20310 [Selenomonas ruminantium subsp. lactilytica TAM6421]|uniref:Uncharacterized protein n=2 Tax=Selenomonas ruminantium TaxID=971 RepID=I0GSK2_SELRL|nr:hypothetical protein SELR_20310 [Selenomonas ruminantium subsp. lactilytica TAM6421]
MVSVVLLFLLFIMLFLGRGLFRLARQEAENIEQYRLEMQLRLAAEGATENLWMRLTSYETQLDALQEGGKISLEQGKAGDIATYTYAVVSKGKLYLVVTAFRRESALEKLLEPHVKLKTEVKKIIDEKGKTDYKWMGWTD